MGYAILDWAKAEASNVVIIGMVLVCHRSAQFYLIQALLIDMYYLIFP